MNSVYLGAVWLSYYVLHSALATSAVKLFFARRIPFLYPFYRKLYSFFAVVNFLLVARFHSLVPGVEMFSPGLIGKVARVLLMCFGIGLGLLAMRQYGLSWLFYEQTYQGNSKQDLQTEGFHAWVRHPLYFSTLLILLGFYLFFPYWKNAIFVFISVLYLIIGTLLEEQKLIDQYGQAYTSYRKRVKMLIPGIF